MAQTIEDVTCLQCGCVCDDLIAHVDNNQVIRVERGCTQAENWLMGNAAEDLSEAKLSGKDASLAEAIADAAELLSTSRAPLVLGPSLGSVDSQRAAIELAEKLGGSFDPGSSKLHRATTTAMQQVGLSTATLGEIKNRADFILFWRSDPQTTHPRFVERFIDSTGTFVPGGRTDRQVIVIDDTRTATADVADQFFELDQLNDLDLLSRLRAAILDKSLAPDSEGGTEADIATQLAAALKNCRYGAILIGADFADGQLATAATETLFQLVAELNSHTRCVVVAMGGPNADEVLTWQTGFPLTVNFAKGFPRYNAEEFAADRLLAAGEVDLVVSIGNEARLSLGDAASHCLDQLPVISIGPPHELGSADRVSMATGIDGIHYGGSVFRMDDVALPLSTPLTTSLPSQASVVRQLKEACQS